MNLLSIILAFLLLLSIEAVVIIDVTKEYGYIGYTKGEIIVPCYDRDNNLIQNVTCEKQVKCLDILWGLFDDEECKTLL